MNERIWIRHENLSSFHELEYIYELFFMKNNIHFVERQADFYEQMEQGETGLEVIQGIDEVVIQYYYRNEMSPYTAINQKVPVKKVVYEILSQQFRSHSKWGILVGIRPVKIVHEMLDEWMTEDLIRMNLKEVYHIHPEKIDLMMDVAYRERPYLVPNDPDAISLYICIPFCPTRCLYCSFPSNDLKSKGKLLQTYLDKLNIEIETAIDHIHSLKKRVDCIYIGGGTPTSMNEKQLEQLLITISNKLDMTLLREFTIEAGRPDTITEQKLKVMKSYGVDRICINPQSMNQETLVKIGRHHQTEEIITVMKMARDIGFRSINMDVILGLPGETTTDAERTIKQIVELKPENITVHTLAVKRASKLHEEIERHELTHDAIVEEMLEDTNVVLREHKYQPYYMYRQKKMIGHLENVGYALEGYESLYNMRIMEEKHSIVACGAGAVSKICEASENRFERVANFKGLEDYLNRFDEILEKKTLLK